jgi:SecD/SecF fusion protein
MNVIVLLVSFVFLGTFIWYLVTHTAATRKRVALGLIASLLFICVWSLFGPQPGFVRAEGAWPINLKKGIDLEGGTQFIIELAGNPDPSAVDQAVEQIRRRIDSQGMTEPVIQPMGDNRIIVQIPGISEADKMTYRQILQRVAKLEFRIVHPNSSELLKEVDEGTALLPFDYEILTMVQRDAKGDESRFPIVVKKRADMGGRYVERAFRSQDEMGRPEVIIDFDSEGRRLFGKLTSENVGRQLAIVLDGEVVSAPIINVPIFGSCRISGGRMTAAEAQELASILENPLETPVSIVDERGVDPSLGAASIRDGLRASVIGFLAVVVFMLVYYRTIGLFAVFALILNVFILLGLLAQFGFTLTLPGVAGIILTIGMAVDANVLIFERIAEEMRLGKPAWAAVHAGFEKAFSSIIDANVTTLIAAAIMFWQGTGAIRGFAVVLCLGILASLFSALIVTRTCFEWSEKRPFMEKLGLITLFRDSKFNFMGVRWLGMAGSILLMLVSFGAWFQKGDRVYGVDFAGGDLLILSYVERIPENDLLAVAGGGTSAQYQASATGDDPILTLRAPFEQGEIIQNALEEAFPQAEFKRLSLDRVQALIGEEFKQKAFTAIILGVVGIFFYVMLRFEAGYAFGAIAALIHDVVVTLGIFTLLGKEFSLPVVGAILTIAGYSINDTIVVFDRVRERLAGEDKGRLVDIMNGALNATLSRTLLTSGTTLLAVLALYIFGGVAIRDFALVLLIGVIVGTYSSIFVASPIVLMFSRRQRRSRAMREAAPAASSS